ncbi:hypothetical protein GCM10009789_49980 [Kribbella sancticallisti]|uniref:Uncharacterized protein n=1 Tax=Kribbella sancticallisti TaxID=460087 RepID=A0ABP4PSU2_9ACTN
MPGVGHLDRTRTPEKYVDEAIDRIERCTAPPSAASARDLRAGQNHLRASRVLKSEQPN